MNLSRRETMQLSARALAALSVAALNPDTAAAQNAAPHPDSLVDTPLRKIEPLPLMPDGSALEYTPQQAGAITGVLWKTKNQTPDIEFDYRKRKLNVAWRGRAT